MHRAALQPLWQLLPSRLGRDVLCHLLSVLIEHRNVLHNDQGVMSHFEDCHELEDSKPSADLQLGELAVQLAQDSRIISSYIENLETLQVQVAVQGLNESLSRSKENVERP